MKTLKKYEFQAFGAGRSDYDWDAILNGSTNQLTQGEDYTCKTVTFATLARSAARKRGMILQTGKPAEGEPEGIVVKASPANEEQLAAWAEADEAAKAKKAEKKAAEGTDGEGEDNGEGEEAETPKAPVKGRGKK